MIRRPDDLDGLVPSFRRQVEALLGALRRRGFQPVVVDGRRTQDEADANATRGAGSRRSMHMWGVAADFADRATRWSDPAFFAALGEQAERQGLVWGGRWQRPDRPHVQAIPATTAAQAEVRLCDKDDVAAVDAICRRYLLG